MLVGVDNSRMIPPTIRAGRGQDVLLNEVSRCLHPASWAVKLPFALPHIRPTPRRKLLPDDPIMLGPERVLWERAHTSAASVIAESPAERLALLGVLFIDLAAAGDAELTEMLLAQAAEYASRIVFGIQEQLDDASLPDAWKQTLRRWLDSPNFRFDSASLRARIASLEEVRAMARSYGRTLIAWPRLWDFCRKHLQ
jgi:hypothetical protein